MSLSQRRDRNTAGKVENGRSGKERHSGFQLPAPTCPCVWQGCKSWHNAAVGGRRRGWAERAMARSLSPSRSAGTSFFCRELLTWCSFSNYVQSSKDRRGGEKKQEGLSFYLMGTSRRSFFSASFSLRLSLMHIPKSGFCLKPLKSPRYQNNLAASSRRGRPHHHDLGRERFGARIG